MHTLLVQGDARLLKALMQGLHTRPADKGWERGEAAANFVEHLRHRNLLHADVVGAWRVAIVEGVDARAADQTGPQGMGAAGGGGK